MPTVRPPSGVVVNAPPVPVVTVKGWKRVCSTPVVAMSPASLLACSPISPRR